MGDPKEIYDDVTRPGHYCHGGYECAAVVEAVLAEAGDRVGGAAAWWTGNLLKYAMRWPFKGATPSERVRDLRKAEECCRRARLCYEAKVAAQRANVAAMAGEVG